MASKRRIESSNFKKKPLWFASINKIWNATYPIGTEIELNKDKLLKAARKECKLNDLGSDFWDEPLDRLLDSINNEAQLHPIGRFITKKRLENLLSVRLRAEYWFKKHPEILEQEIYPTNVILGLQRTGTTKLQRMLASDPNCRSLRSWEALNPSPIKGDIHSGKERIKFAKMSENALKYMSPGFFAIHPVEHLAPEEDVLLLDVSFLSTTAEATMNVPSYASWLEKTDQSIAYEYMAKLMRFLQFQSPAKKWVLKTPHHLEFPDLLDKYIPDVQFIWTHRDVKDAIPSFLSMVAHSRILFSNEVEANDVANHWVKKISYMLEKAMKYRQDTNNNDRFTDIKYTDLLQDSIEVLSKIYRKRGEVIGDDLISIFNETERNSPKGKYGSHHYNFEDFGIELDFLNLHTQNYQDFQKNIMNL